MEQVATNAGVTGQVGEVEVSEDLWVLYFNF